MSTPPVNSVKKDSSSNEFSWSCRSSSSESLHSGSKELKSHELPEFSCWLVPEPFTASYGNKWELNLTSAISRLSMFKNRIRKFSRQYTSKQRRKEIGGDKSTQSSYLLGSYFMWTRFCLSIPHIYIRAISPDVHQGHLNSWK